MKTTIPLHGVIVPMITPFDAHNQIDFNGLRQVVDFLVEKGVHGLMPGGTTGEGMLLSLDERKALLETVLDQVRRRLPVVAHAGCIDTASTVELARHAVKAGADVISAIVPYYFTYNDDQIYTHYMTLAAAVPETPLLLYTYPGNAKNDIAPTVLERLRKNAPNIVGIKSSNPDLARFQSFIRVGGEGFTASLGVDDLMLAALALGGKAQIPGNANAFPESFVRLYDAFQAGDLALARQMQEQINVIVNIPKPGGSIAFIKAAMILRGVPAGRVRPPMSELSAAELGRVKSALAQAGWTRAR